MKRIKLLVVDDSILFREVLSRYIRQDVQIDIVGTAGDPYSARDLILEYEPDVMTLDVEMPRMDGVAFLKRLLPQYYVPTIIVSSSEEHKRAALEAGAMEFIPKPIARTNSDMERFANVICTAIKRAYAKGGSSIGRAGIRPIAGGKAPEKTEKPESIIRPIGNFSSTPTTPTTPTPAAKAPEPPARQSSRVIPHNGTKFRKTDVIIALGASTGGTEALEQVVKVFPEDTPPVIIVQHMPAGFTKLYSDRLNRNCKMQVKEAEDGDRLRRGLIIIGAGEHHLRLCRDARGYYVTSKTGDKVSGHCPSVDVMFTSVAEVAGANAIGAILTGMGRDGANGLLKMRNAGAFTIGQDKESCVVYGMPMEAFNIGAVEIQAPLYNIPDIILNQLY
ncbi:MAG: chemotaxis response regulator protein-glutamate methylesterase [Oscillospiraceae bacterium]|nr:chemotaxis response regulator protein-glutamate methylesterase [Oscillospiraceae bacterium]